MHNAVRDAMRAYSRCTSGVLSIPPIVSTGMSPDDDQRSDEDVRGTVREHERL